MDARSIIANARTAAVHSVDYNRVMMYWHLGRRIFEEEQQGKERADYGARLIRGLAERLEPEYGSGFGHRQLAFCRQFYRVYPIVNTLYSQLNWSQYKLLISIDDIDKREYYQLEAVIKLAMDNDNLMLLVRFALRRMMPMTTQRTAGALSRLSHLLRLSRENHPSN